MLSVLGEVSNDTMVFLVDSGASNNFLSKNDAKKLNLTLHTGPASVVRLADGKQLKCT